MDAEPHFREIWTAQIPESKKDVLTQTFRNPVTSHLNGAFRRKEIMDRLKPASNRENPWNKTKTLSQSHRCLIAGTDF